MSFLTLAFRGHPPQHLFPGQQKNWEHVFVASHHLGSFKIGFKILISSRSGFSRLALQEVLGALHTFLNEGKLLSKNLTNDANM